METTQYNAIIEVIRNHEGLSKDCLLKLNQNFPDISQNTLASILSLEYQNRMKHLYHKSAKKIDKYYSEYCKYIDNKEGSGVIIKMAKKHGITPCLIGKLILQKHLENMNENQSEKPQQNINIYMKNPSLIPDPNLSYELYLCTLYDDQYSPLAEVIKRSIGQEYELFLERTLKERNLAFRNEEYLRRYGYDKTPDFKLEVPIYLDGIIINWVESKALFGTEEGHSEYMKSQYFSYWNRFGPGLIIYWFGFMKSIINPEDKRFIIRDGFPEDTEITTLH